MDAVIRTYGNTNLPDGTAELPLVTFAVFGYMQEHCIRDALAAGLAQNYSPLEIIMSDDCSTDKTFQLMETIAKDYHGPHKILIRRSEVNLGTALHVSAVASIAKGALIVVAAGDDTSLPNRCEAIVERWTKAGQTAVLVHSDMEVMTSNGVERLTPPLADHESGAIDLLLKGPNVAFFAPTCAYAIELFKDYDPLFGGSIIEDGVLSVRAILSGSIEYIPIPLVRQGRYESSSSNDLQVHTPARWNRLVRSRIVASCNSLHDLIRIDESAKNKKKLEKFLRRRIAVLGRFIIPEHRNMSNFECIKFCINLVIFYPINASILRRVKFSLIACGFKSSRYYKFFLGAAKKWR
ncbi:glycosyltransferase [Tabrizicola sp.]|uniref:glycosyltransferase n=1 Tax=Tabrizicola sp. TaxID=2005166 RepID=UPI0027329E26|nr:glycosyltransferase [Tabrizicola sp.]MDP3197165.1 glycosyltransferase [Tabrizicola sp.]MDZ4067896.1 glycosyltransferase [Tabrizicola sp.]